MAVMAGRSRGRRTGDLRLAEGTRRREDDLEDVPLRPDVKIPDFPKTAQGKADLDDFKYKIYGDGPRTKNALPARYGDPELSGLTREVAVGRENRFDFNLE